MKILQATFCSVIYFLFNTLLLPPPVVWTLFAAGFKIRSVLRSHKKSIIAGFCVLSIYAIIHLLLGVEVRAYIKSMLFLGVLVVAAFGSHEWLKTAGPHMPRVFERVGLGALALLALGFLFQSSTLSRYFWINHDFIGKGEGLNRFVGLAYEPSHFALTLSPVVAYFTIRVLLNPNLRDFGFLVAVSLPVALTFSFGFVAAAALTSVVVIAIAVTQSARLTRRWLGPIAATGMIALVICSNSNPISDRIAHILRGQDTSVNGRTHEAFMLAYRCAETKSPGFGIGPGQVKYVGEKVIRPYYLGLDPVGYTVKNWPVLALPNSMAETLAMFGFTGVLLKIALQIFLFIRFRIYQNLWQLSVFSFIFFYQLMGSFMLSATEITMWVMACAPLFPDMDLRRETPIK